MTWQVAAMSIRTGIAPTALMDTPPEVWAAMVTLLNEQTEKTMKASRRRR